MKQEEKDLLLKDLCARLSYGVKCQIQEDEHTHIGTLCRVEIDKKNGHLLDFVESINYLDCQFYISEVKPYLFPLSSMTEEQEIEFKGLLSEVYDFSFRMEELLEFIQSQENIPFHFMDWLAKNNFDYRGLIPLGLAIDATNLNVY